MPRPTTIDGLPETGRNLDDIDVDAGMATAVAIGYTEPNMRMLAEYCLTRWAKGEEDHAQSTAIHMGIDLTSWLRILAAAMAGAHVGRHRA